VRDYYLESFYLATGLPRNGFIYISQYFFLDYSRSRSYFRTDSHSVSQSVSLGIEYPCGTCDQILFPVGMLLSEICGLVSLGCPL
jgi:hypothetical protein